MDEEKWETFWKKLREIYEKEDGNTEAYELEKPIMDKLLRRIEEKLRDIYEFVGPIGKGGAGIVIHIRDKRLKLDRALKIPRPKEEKLIESIKNERDYLTKMKHENIISIYALGDVKGSEFSSSYPYFVMDYIEGAQNLRMWVQTLLEEAIESKELKKITKWVAEMFYYIAEAVNYLHENQIIHFDIKPYNILIDKNDKPILSDLGFAKKRTDEASKVVVGFTLFYAHPDLRIEYYHMSSKNRVKKEMAPVNFKYIFDIYAFGKSLLEILSLIDQKFPDVVVYDYTFVYLHLAACRMLDGRNIPEDEARKIREKQIQDDKLSVYKETWGGLDVPDFEDIKYQTFEEVCRDFEKLLYGESFLETITELNAFHPKRIQSSQGIPAPFTERVKCIVEHPVFQRLVYIPQLSLLNYVYPTATHNRLEHSIGTFGYCCLYIQSLYNDQYNPLFKQVMSEEDIKCVLLASLLHDLGQYPLAHEIEDNSRKLKHEDFTLIFLDNPTKDKHGHTLQDIIRNKEWGWGVELDRVKKILEKEEQKSLLRENLKIELLSSLIDGPIDVDKVDYLLRDSQNCYLRYGELIDFDRLIRNLTVIISEEDHRKTFTVGTYEKGQSAAESLTFARYLLYQSLYWHHTARAVRAMLREAVNPALGKKTKGRYGNFFRDFERVMGMYETPRNITIEDILDLIEKWTDEEGKQLIEMIKNRNYFKRILTIHRYPSPEEKGKKSLLERFEKVYTKPVFQEKLQRTIKEKFEYHLSYTEYSSASALAPDKTDRVFEVLSTPKKVICDCPEPIYGTSDKLRFIPEPQKLQRNYLVRADTGERVSEVWNEVYYTLMNIASKGRVFCHPDIRDSLMVALGPEGIKECLEDVIRELEY